MKFQESLTNMFRAVYPLVAIESPEEASVLRDIRHVVGQYLIDEQEKRKKEQASLRYYEWDAAVGLLQVQRLDQFVREYQAWQSQDVADRSDQQPEYSITLQLTQDQKPITNPTLMLQRMLADQESNIVVLKDVGPLLEMPVIRRMLRSLIPNLKRRQSMVVLLAPQLKLPADLTRDVQMLPYPRPKVDQIATFFANYAATIGRRATTDEPTLEKCHQVAESAAGMTMAEVENVLALCTVSRWNEIHSTSKSVTRVPSDQFYNATYCQQVFETKTLNLRTTSALTYRPVTSGFASIGGLDRVKDWARKRRQGFDSRARDLNLPYPKGILLAGVKGCGKSSIAMAIAHEFEFPLFMFDIGALFGSKVGESEAATRDALQTIESLGRCVVLID